MNSHSEQSSHKRSFISSIYHSLFRRAPKNRAELLNLICYAERCNVIDSDTREMLDGVMKIAELRVRDIMIPRSQMVTLTLRQPLDECIKVITETAYSRFPITSDDKEHVCGLLMAKDLLNFKRSDAAPFSMEEVMRSANVVPESKRIDRILKEFRSQRYHMAIVVDEFGSVSGLVTIEDILEEIVGDIEDEFSQHSESECKIREVNPNIFSVSALTLIEDFNEFFGTKYSDKEVDTVGGMVMQAFGHLPKRGEEVIIDSYQFKVSISDGRHLIQLLVTKVQVPAAEQ